MTSNDLQEIAQDPHLAVLKALWVERERLAPDSPEYWDLLVRIRAAADAFLRSTVSTHQEP